MELSETLNYEGCNFSRQRIVLSILSGRPIKISQIRPLDDEPGLRDFEMKFLKIIDQVTNGSRMEINRTGTEIRYWPGMMQGGTFEYDCGNDRCLSYFLEPLIVLAPFAKLPMKARLTGVTNAPDEPSVDALRATWLPVFSKFILDNEALDIKLTSRGLKPDGGGLVTFTSPIIKQLRPVQTEKVGKVCKVRGLAYVTKVSPTLASRMIDSAKKALQGFLSDVYITVDQRKGINGGNSPGYGLFLTAETTEGVVFHGEAISKPKGDKGDPLVPEDIGQMAANRLLDEINRGGCLDSSAQSLGVVFMSLGQKDVSKFLFGPLSNYCVYTLRHLRDFFDVTFKIDQWSKQQKEDEQEMRLGSKDKALMTCVGVGYSNMNKVLL
uniref:RNA 3'-terminal phosphate cyclase-like protein n=1 Tax=Plectus sambesii TaxID=2011161 RepID=A0A914VBE2_9BILA